jgi:hypothetical protein
MSMSAGPTLHVRCCPLIASRDMTMSFYLESLLASWRLHTHAGNGTKWAFSSGGVAGDRVPLFVHAQHSKH